MSIGSLLMRVQSVSIGGKLSDGISTVAASVALDSDHVGMNEFAPRRDVGAMPRSNSVTEPRVSDSGRSEGASSDGDGDARRLARSHSIALDHLEPLSEVEPGGVTLLKSIDPKLFDVPEHAAPLADVQLPPVQVSPVQIKLLVTAIGNKPRRVGGKKRVTYHLHVTVPIMTLLASGTFKQRIGNADLSVSLLGSARFRFASTVRIVSLPPIRRLSSMSSADEKGTWADVTSPAERHQRRARERDVDLSAAVLSSINAIAEESVSPLDGDFNVLGTGGYGNVRAVQWHGASVALKLFTPTTPADDECVSSFMTEVRVLTSMRHPCLIALNGISVDGLLGLVLERAPGVDLSVARVGDARRPATWRALLRVMKDLCAALSCLHEMGIVHNDVKPANVLLNVEESATMLAAAGPIDEARASTVVAKLCDFGSCVDVGYKLTQGACGSLDYRAPTAYIGGSRDGDPLLGVAAREHDEYEDAAYADGDMDVYSAAMTMFAAIAGHEPLKGLDSLKYMHVKEAKLGDGWRPKLPSEWPQQLRDLLASMWHKSRAQRLTAPAISSKLELMAAAAGEWKAVPSLGAVVDALDSYSEEAEPRRRFSSFDAGDGVPDALANLSTRELTNWLRSRKYPMATVSSVSRVNARGFDLCMSPLGDWLKRRGVNGFGHLAEHITSKERPSLVALQTLLDQGALFVVARPEASHTPAMYLLVTPDADGQAEARSIAERNDFNLVIVSADMDFLADMIARYFVPTVRDAARTLTLELVHRYDDAIASVCDNCRELSSQAQLDAIVAASLGEAHFVRVSFPGEEGSLRATTLSDSEDDSSESSTLGESPMRAKSSKSSRSEATTTEEDGALKSRSHSGRLNKSGGSAVSGSGKRIVSRSGKRSKR